MIGRGLSGGGLPAAAGRALGGELAALGSALGQSTVQVHCPGRGGHGSGVIWSRDGLIITNAHVAREQKPDIRLRGGEWLRGRVVRVDPRRDLAAVVIEGRDLPAVVVGDPCALRPGELVVALGAPWGIEGALTVGVLHAVEDGWRPGMPQVVCADVRLAPGNSGGPLADVRGRVIGINAMIVRGLGIAVSTRAVVEFLGELAAVRGDVRAA